MYSRKPHTKSRNGCGQCKRRHIKCDLQAPICSYCRKQGKPCDYQLLHADKDSLMLGQTQTLDLTRLNHFTRRVFRFSSQIYVGPSQLLSLMDYEDHLWEAELSQGLGRQPFMQHAITALYLYKQQHLPSATHAEYQIALSHEIEASYIFRNSISTINEQNWMAWLMFAVFVFICHIQAAKKFDGDYVMDAMSILRSTSKLTKAMKPFFNRSWIPAMIQRRLKQYSSFDDPTMLSAIASLNSMVSGLVLADELDHVYGQDIGLLNQWIVMTQGHPQTWLHIFWWPASVSPMYMLLLEQRDPVAVMIFLHWCAIIKHCPSRWFLDGWATNLASLVFEAVGSEYYALLSWPRDILNL